MKGLVLMSMTTSEDCVDLCLFLQPRILGEYAAAKCLKTLVADLVIVLDRSLNILFYILIGYG